MEMKILITGDPLELGDRLPRVSKSGHSISWRVAPVLKYEKIIISQEQLERDFDWLVFTSPRSVRFWSELVLEAGRDVPYTVRVAVMGKRTAQAAEEGGWSVDFIPSTASSEMFLEEFIPLIQSPQRFVIPGSDISRSLIPEILEKRGHQVTRLALYKTVKNPEVCVDDRVDVLVFTSPSSFDAFRERFPALVAGSLLIAMGQFTANHMRKEGSAPQMLVPAGDITRIAEVL